MKRLTFFSAVACFLLWVVFCELPQDPATMTKNSGIDLVVKSIAADTGGIYHDTVGRSVSFKAYRELSNLIDSFVVDFGGDTSIAYATDDYNSDTVTIQYAFTSAGRKSVSLSIYFNDRSTRSIDSVAVFDIVNDIPRFAEGKPDTSYAVDGGDSVFIPVHLIDTRDGRLSLHLGARHLPDSAVAELVDDSLLIVFVPENSSGNYTVAIAVTDTVDTFFTTIGLAVSDKTPPLPPKFLTPSVVNTDVPTWVWESGGNGGEGVYRYALDNNDFSGEKSTETDTTLFKSPSSLSEGTHTLFVQERDSSGNWSKTASWAIRIDRQGPDAPVVTGPRTTNDRTPTWTWTGSDVSNPVFRVKLDSAKFTAVDTLDTSATEFTALTELAEGNHTLYVQERDEAGNYSASGSFTIRIDLTGPKPPVVTGTTPTANRRPVWTWTPGGEGCGVYRCALDSNVFAENAVTPSARTYIAPEDMSEGEHTLYVQEQDSAGNWSASGSFAAVIDVTPPGAPVFTSPALSGSLQPQWTWTSGGGGSGKFRYRLDNDDLAGVSPAETNSFTSPTNLSQGPHTFFLQEIDSTGNWSVVVSQVIVIDTIPPSPPEVSGTALTSSTRPVWTWVMGPGGNGTFRLKLDSNTMANGADTTDTNAYTPAADLSEGVHRLYVQQMDQAGNWSMSDSFATTVDLTPPAAPTVFGSSVTNSLQPVWSWSSGGNGSGEYRYKLDEDDLSTGATVTSATSFTPGANLSEAAHTLYVQERDAAGNWSASGTFVTTIDATAAGAPTVSAVSPTNNTLPVWTWVSGGGSGSFRYKLDSQDFAAGAVETTAFTFTPAAALAEGVHILYVQEDDGSGNWSGSGLFAVLIDLTPPPPPVVSGTTPTSDRTPAWSWTSGGGTGAYRYKLDDNTLASGATVTGTTTFSPSADLTAGTHTLYVAERDAAGNWSTAAGFAIVIDTAAPTAPVVTGVTPTNDRTPLWTWTAGSGGNGIFRYKIDSGEFTGETTELQYVPGADLSEGAHTLYVQERNGAGNWSPSGVKTIMIDVTPPDPPTITGPALTNDPAPTWTWTSGGGRGLYRWRLDQSDIDGDPVVTSDTSYTLPAAVTDEVHVVYIKEQDSAGNWSVPVSYTVTIDITPPKQPEIVASGTSASPSGSSAITWTWQSGGGGNGNFRYRFDAGEWSTDAAVKTYTYTVPDDRMYTLEIAERDDAGNWSMPLSHGIYVLPAPGNLTIGSVPDSGSWGERLTWKDNSTNESKFYIYKYAELCSEVKGRILCKKGYLLLDSVAANVTNYTDFDVTSCDTFSYYVAAVRDGQGKTSSDAITHKAVQPGTKCLIVNPPIITFPVKEPDQVIPAMKKED